LGLHLTKRLKIIQKDCFYKNFIDLKSYPEYAMLIKNDSFLVIGTSDFYLKFFNLETPLRPNLIKSIKLQSCMGAIFEMTKDELFCG
jgi:hypothetical protein